MGVISNNESLLPQAFKDRYLGRVKSTLEISSSAKSTPMMNQWRDLKALAGDSLLFFRLGDFYELFETDAVVAAPVMGVTLTSRNSKAPENERQPLCGVPFGNFEIYLTKLLNAGFSVALAEQTEEPKPGKSIVRREIVQWFTPGMRLLENDDQPHYIAVLSGSEKRWVVAAADVATGHSLVERGEGIESLQDFLERWSVEDFRKPAHSELEVRVKFKRDYRTPNERRARELILNLFGLASLEDLDVDGTLEFEALGGLAQIILDAHLIRKPRLQRPNQSPHQVSMNASTRRHLHLFEPKEKSLFNYLDECRTAVGRRLLRARLSSPTSELSEIQRRQSLIASLKQSGVQRRSIRSALGTVLDIERLLRKQRSPLTLWNLVKSLRAIVDVAPLFPESNESKALLTKCHDLKGFMKDLESKLQWSTDSEQGWILKGVSCELDDLRALKANANDHLAQLEESMRKNLSISTLKLKMHQVFGLVADVTSQHREKIPASARIIQTLANAQRFKTPELESLERDLLSVESRVISLERVILEELFQKVSTEENLIQESILLLAELDWAQSMAEISERNSWSTPKCESSMKLLDLQEARHPLIGEDFVPLSFRLHETDLRVLLLTGPNMAGKSTVMRLAALCALLHQIGSDVPASQARLSLFDRIGCRMGAGDDLGEGKSTFFMEVREVASLLQGANEKSLLLFDEIGRGTSTYDGMSLAWAITEYLHEKKSLAIVATHYLEMAPLEAKLSALKNYHLGVEERNGRLLFTRQLVYGPASRSYGIQVARLADLPESILERAQEKLKEFETKTAKKQKLPLFEWGGSRESSSL